ncbi:MAG: hypothetical protein ABSH31_13025 [Bryobacteraceae bacterium]|jgi:20S proteasome alpha/beta subunit
MTIALGAMCLDGVVLAVDLQHTTDIVKTAGQKLFVLTPSYRPELNYSVIVAGARNADSVRKAVETMEETVSDRFSGRTPALKELKKALQDSLEIVFREHIDFAPPEERADLHFDLLIAIRIASSCHLFRTNRTMLIQEKSTACIGIGLYFANYAAEEFLVRNPTVEIAAQVATYIISRASTYIEGIGKGADIHVLRSDGRHYSFMKPERESVEQRFEKLFAAFRNLLRCVDVASTPDEGIQYWNNLVLQEITELRNLQTRRAEIRQISEQRDPESPTHGQQSLRPLPESPGGSDES